jgi:hypothetical protein
MAKRHVTTTIILEKNQMNDSHFTPMALGSIKHRRTGFYESWLSKMTQPSLDSSIVDAVGQMIRTDGHNFWIDPETSDLHVPCWPLRELEIGGYKLSPTTESDLRPMLDHPCIRGSTVTLIGPRHVLTTAHSVAFERLISHVFVFGRTLGASHVTIDADQRRVDVSGQHVYRAKRLLAYVDTHVSDWAVIELYRDVVGIEPLRVGRWRSNLRADVLGHPLGLPLIQGDVQPYERGPGSGPTYQIDVDAGSGGSGSPLIQSGAVVGVMTGSAAVDRGAVVTIDGVSRFDPALAEHRRFQPFTPAAHFAPAIPELTGW